MARGGEGGVHARRARGFGLSIQIQRVEIRRDALASRRRWQFALREEAVLSESL